MRIKGKKHSYSSKKHIEIGGTIYKAKVKGDSISLKAVDSVAKESKLRLKLSPKETKLEKFIKELNIGSND